jgi:hypothetical protein
MFFMSFYKKNLTLLAILLAIIFQANGQTDTFYYTWGPIPKQDASFNMKATISGSVKDAHGNAVAQAEVLFEEISVAKTDEQGQFQFEKSFAGYPKVFSLTIRHPSMNDVVRTYHPTMASTSYDIVMKNLEDCCRPAPFKSIEMDFSAKKIILDDNMKSQLVTIASTLRQNPNVYIELTSYGDNGIENTLAKYRQESISNYLVDEEGISAERIRFKTITGKKNTVVMRVIR